MPQFYLLDMALPAIVSINNSHVFLAVPVAPVVHETEDISTTETSVKVTVWHALQINGPIRYHFIQFLRNGLYLNVGLISCVIHILF